MDEKARQIFHALLGIIFLFLLYYLGRYETTLITAGILLIGSLVINLKIRKVRFPVLDRFLKKMERDKARFPGYGSAWFFTGLLISLSFSDSVAEISALVWILSMGDSFSTLIGRKGKIKWPHNKGKTIEGSCAFFLASLPAYFFIGPVAFALAFVCMLAETVNINIDDNALVPFVGAIFLMIL
ncbi:hypothetical protein JXB01_03375 [Candidatus Micrarchaeota archaeon]|nr:hypothetical protein [Candidatus Micrarchaeota archaeon]